MIFYSDATDEIVVILGQQPVFGGRYFLLLDTLVGMMSVTINGEATPGRELGTFSYIGEF